MPRLILLIFSLLAAFNSHAQHFDTLQLHYDIGVFRLDNKHKNVLDSVVAHYSNNRILIYGYADYLGNENPNLLLSEQRAKAVLKYLTDKGFPEANVMQCIGSGQVNTKKTGEEGNTDNRRTDIYIIKTTSITKQEAVETMVQETPPVKTPVSTTEKVTQIDYNNLQVGDTINLQHIGFYPGLKLILPSSYPEVDNLIGILQTHPALKIRLEGHVCCCTYPDGYFENTPHWQLSVARAKELRAVLIKHGISAERLEYKGFGRTHPIVDNEQTSEQGQVNRRVEIRILAK